MNGEQTNKYLIQQEREYKEINRRCINLLEDKAHLLKLLTKCKNTLYAIRDGAYGLWGEDVDLCNAIIDAIEKEGL